MPKAKNKSTGKESTFVEQKNETVIVFEGDKSQRVVSKVEFNEKFEVLTESANEQPTQ